MGESEQPEWATERVERWVTVVFVILGLAFLVGAVYLAHGQFDVAVAAWNDPGDRAPSRAVMAALNRAILAGFIGAVLFASGVLRWRE